MHDMRCDRQITEGQGSWASEEMRNGYGIRFGNSFVKCGEIAMSFLYGDIFQYSIF